MTLEQLAHIVALATTPGRFYRRVYGMQENDAPLSISSWEEWLALPFLTKKDLTGTPLLERAFVPLGDIDYLTSSSGTTGTLPLFTPRAHLNEYAFRTRFYDFSGAVLSSKPVPHQHEQFLSALDLPPRVVVLDVRNPGASAHLARAAGVDALFTYTSYVPFVAEHLAREGVAPHIKFIEIGGDACSHAQFELMRKIFPNAVITSTYGISDFENSPMGIACRPMTEREPVEIYHEKDGVYVELLDTETGVLLEPTAGAEGELVVTTYRGEPAAFPTLRYRTGDRARVYEEHCREHGKWSFIVLGRLDIDSVKIPGGMLKADEIERVLRMFKGTVTDKFVLRVRDAQGGRRVRAIVQVELHSSLDLDRLASDIAKELRVSPTTTYQDGVARGLYEPLKCEVLPATGSFQGKQNRIILEP